LKTLVTKGSPQYWFKRLNLQKVDSRLNIKKMKYVVDFQGAKRCEVYLL
jgi:hypothetical protein